MYNISIEYFYTYLNKGGRDGSSKTDVLEYKAQTDQWKIVGHLAKGRSYHGMSLVPFETEDFCV